MLEAPPRHVYNGVSISSWLNSISSGSCYRMATTKNDPANSRLLSRLQRDLKDLLSNPYPGIDVHHDDANIRKMCLILSPLGGPFVGLRLHFKVSLPSTWPVDPPRIKSSTQLDHPNVFGSYICSDLLREFSSNW